MAEVLKLVGHWLLGIVGVLLCYSAVFLHTDEEGKLENRIQQWWERVERLKKSALSQEVAFIKTVVRITSLGLARIFGESLFKSRAVLSSICFSSASMGLTYFVVTGTRKTEISIATISLSFLFLGVSRVFLNNRFWVLWGWSVALLTIGSAIYIELPLRGLVSLGVMAPLCIVPFALIIGVASDYIFIVITRLILMAAGRLESLFAILTLLFCNLCLGIVLFVVPAVVAINQPDIISSVKPAFYFVAFSNVLDCIVSSIFLFIAVIMLLNRIVWPLIERPMYALNRYRIFSEQKKLLFFSGLFLFGMAWPQFREELEKVKSFLESAF